MSFQVTVLPGGHQIGAEADETLLEAALRQGVLLPYGCRDGACGACKGKVLAGQIEQGRVSALSAEESVSGHALFCRARAKSDVTIECRQVSLAGAPPVKTLPARIERLERLAPDVIELGLRLPASEQFDFLAGQYIDILLKDGGRRSFSLAQAPGEPGLLSLHIRHVPGGVFTDQVFGSLKVRDILRINGPHGSFFLREASTKPIILVAGGTGFAPIKSIVEHAIRRNLQRPLHLYWGARSRVDLYLPDLPRAWAKAGHLSYVPVLSQLQVVDDWQGRTGWVHAAVLADFPDLAAYQVYACGAPAMVDAARRDFAAAGLPDAEFFADAFLFSR